MRRLKPREQRPRAQPCAERLPWTNPNALSKHVEEAILSMERRIGIHRRKGSAPARTPSIDGDTSWRSSPSYGCNQKRRTELQKPEQSPSPSAAPHGNFAKPTKGQLAMKRRKHGECPLPKS